MKKLKLILTLFLTFFKIGAFTFGGGYAMIPLIEKEVIEKKKWISEDLLLEILAIAESTPGPIAINAATWIGYQQFGFWGALVATVAICIPSFVIIYSISLFLDTFLTLTVVANAFRGIQVCVVYLIFRAGWKLKGSIPKKPLPMTILFATVAALVATTVFSLHFSTVFYILISGVIGLLFYGLKGRKGAEA